MVVKTRNTRGPRARKLDSTELYARAISKNGLWDGWHKTRANKGACGGDRITVDMFERDAIGWIARLRRSLLSGEYRPGRLRNVDIPKKSGGIRTLSIPCISDRVIQSSVAQILTPILDQEFEPESYAYRPGRSVAQAVARVSAAQRAGFDWIIDADIEDFFGSVRHDALMQRWHESFDPGPLGDLIDMWLTYAAPEGIGLAQGSPISPLLANLFLDRLDETFQQGRYRFVRFADDFVILAKSQESAERAMVEARDWLARCGLKLNMQKSRVIRFDQGLKFLGHLFVNSLVTKSVNPDGDGPVVDWMRRVALEDNRKSDEADKAEQKIEEQRKAGYALGFRTLYIHEAGRRLHIRNQSFAVQEAIDSVMSGVDISWKELIALNHNQVDRIEIGPKGSVSPQASGLCLATDTPLAYVNGFGETMGWLSSGLVPRAGRHLAQAGLIHDEERRLDLARRIVLSRVRTQRAVLQRISRKNKNEQVVDGILGLKRYIGHGGRSRIIHAETIQQLMGYEGASAKHWWRALSGLMPRNFQFPARNRQAPILEPANAVFNFLSWLLARDVTVATARAGLHAGFGVLHSSRDRNDACAYDLMEPFRAHLIGGLAVFCVNKKIITQTDFYETPDGGVGLRTPAQKSLIKAYEARIARPAKSAISGRKLGWRLHMLEQANAYGQHVEGIGTFNGIEMDY